MYCVVWKCSISSDKPHPAKSDLQSHLLLLVPLSGGLWKQMRAKCLPMHLPEGNMLCQHWKIFMNRLQTVALRGDQLCLQHWWDHSFAGATWLCKPQPKLKHSYQEGEKQRTSPKHRSRTRLFGTGKAVLKELCVKTSLASNLNCTQTLVFLHKWQALQHSWIWHET